MPEDGLEIQRRRRASRSGYGWVTGKPRQDWCRILGIELLDTSSNTLSSCNLTIREEGK